MKAFSVKSSSLVKSWSPRVLLRDDSVTKYCVVCGGELMYLMIYEGGVEEEVLHCSACGMRSKTWHGEEYSR